MLADAGSAGEMLPLHEERLLVSTRVRKTLVRAARTTMPWTVAADEDLSVEQVVTHVPIGRVRRQEVTVTRKPVAE